MSTLSFQCVLRYYVNFFTELSPSVDSHRSTSEREDKISTLCHNYTRNVYPQGNTKGSKGSKDGWVLLSLYREGPVLI